MAIFQYSCPILYSIHCALVVGVLGQHGSIYISIVNCYINGSWQLRPWQKECSRSQCNMEMAISISSTAIFISDCAIRPFRLLLIFLHFAFANGIDLSSHTLHPNKLERNKKSRFCTKRNAYKCYRERQGNLISNGSNIMRFIRSYSFKLRP